MLVYDRLLIQPCLFETRLEYFKRWNKENFVARASPCKKDPFCLCSDSPLEYFRGCDEFEWKGASKKFDTLWQTCTYNGSLEYLPKKWSSSCSSEGPKQFWNHLVGNIVRVHLNANIPTERKHITVLLVTHHHRIKKSIFPISPDWGSWRTGKPLGFGNASAIQVTLDFKSKPLIKILDPGNVEKNKYSLMNNRRYIASSDDLFDIKMIHQILSLTGLSMNIIVVRHANSLHNAPTRIKRWDSVLTAQGQKEINYLGTKISKVISPTTTLYACASTLRRTQHTALLLLQSTLKVLPENLDKLLKFFNDNSKFAQTKSGREMVCFPQIRKGELVRE